MKAVVQRVKRAGVRIVAQGAAMQADLAAHPGEASIGQGLAVLVGVGEGDGPEDADRLAAKIAALRVFDDDSGKMNRSVLDVGGAILAVSQFTLHADTRKGNRPSFTGAAEPQTARSLVARFVQAVRARGVPVETGVFGAAMEVEIVNDGPVTIVLDTREGRP